MQSKWLDAGIELGAWHLQSKRYDDIKPPTFGANPQMNSVVRRRERVSMMTPAKLKHLLDTNNDDHFAADESLLARKKKRPLWKRLGSKREKTRKNEATAQCSNEMKSINSRESIRSFGRSIERNSPRPSRSINNQSKTERTPFNRRSQMSHLVSVANLEGGMENEKFPSLFLQEASHLLSLLSAVAFTTLRVDLYKAPAPLTEYEVGSPWPSVDPDDDEKKNQYYESSGFVKSMNYLLGNVRTDAQRTVSIIIYVFDPTRTFFLKHENICNRFTIPADQSLFSVE